MEPGESPEQALVREIAEELGVTIAVTGWLAGEAAIGSAYVLTVATALLVEGEPAPTEHDEVRWLSADQLGDVDWLEPDRPFLAELKEILESVRGIFFDEQHARAVVARLLADGYDAELVRERLAGEDDDEDHPWAVLSDAPEIVLELLVDQYDGWLDAGPESATRGAARPAPGAEADQAPLTQRLAELGAVAVVRLDGAVGARHHPRARVVLARDEEAGRLHFAARPTASHWCGVPRSRPPRSRPRRGRSRGCEHSEATAAGIRAMSPSLRLTL